MRYLIVKTSAFGDIIHAYGVLEYLKQQDPECQVDWVVEKRMAALVSGHPLVSRTIEVDTKKWRSNLFTKASWQEIQATRRELQQESYDAVFDLQGNIKSAIITFLARSKNKVGFGFKKAPEAISALSYNHRYNPPSGQNIRSDYLFLVESYFNLKTAVGDAPSTQSFEPESLAIGGAFPTWECSPPIASNSNSKSCIDEASPTAVFRFNKKNHINQARLLNTNEPIPKLLANWLIAPGSNWKNKQLTYDTLAAFLVLCYDAYHPNFVFLCGSEQEHLHAQELTQKFPGSEILYKPSLPVLQHIMSSLQLVVSMDSLPLHLAATAGCPTFSFFGPSSSQKYNPLGIIHGAYQGRCPYGQTFERRCPKLRTCPTGACLREVSPETLFAAFQAWHGPVL